MVRRFMSLAGAFAAVFLAGVTQSAADSVVAVAPFDAKKAQALQKESARQLKVPLTLTSSSGLRLHLIPAGEFTMGSPKTERYRDEDELLHKVKITKPFYIGTHEVTQGEWKKVMESEPWNGKAYV